MKKCTENHDYKPVGNIIENKKGDMVQVVYCPRCADRKEILIKSKKD